MLAQFIYNTENWFYEEKNEKENECANIWGPSDHSVRLQRAKP